MVCVLRAVAVCPDARQLCRLFANIGTVENDNVDVPRVAAVVVKEVSRSFSKVLHRSLDCSPLYLFLCVGGVVLPWLLTC